MNDHPISYSQGTALAYGCAETDRPSTRDQLVYRQKVLQGQLDAVNKALTIIDSNPAVPDLIDALRAANIY